MPLRTVQEALRGDPVPGQFVLNRFPVSRQNKRVSQDLLGGGPVQATAPGGRRRALLSFSGSPPGARTRGQVGEPFSLPGFGWALSSAGYVWVSHGGASSCGVSAGSRVTADARPRWGAFRGRKPGGKIEFVCWAAQLKRGWGGGGSEGAGLGAGAARGQGEHSPQRGRVCAQRAPEFQQNFGSPRLHDKSHPGGQSRISRSSRALYCVFPCLMARLCHRASVWASLISLGRQGHRGARRESEV